MVTTAVVVVLERGVDNLKDGVLFEINHRRRQRMTRQVRDCVVGNCVVIIGGEVEGVLDQVLRVVDGVLERILDGMLDSLEIVDREILQAMSSGLGDLIKKRSRRALSVLEDEGRSSRGKQRCRSCRC